MRVDEKALHAASECAGTPALEWIIAGGEDHGLLATFPTNVPLPDGFRPIGRVRACDDGEAPGAFMDGVELRGGWDHFKQD